MSRTSLIAEVVSHRRESSFVCASRLSSLQFLITKVGKELFSVDLGKFEGTVDFSVCDEQFLEEVGEA